MISEYIENIRQGLEVVGFVTVVILVYSLFRGLKRLD